MIPIRTYRRFRLLWVAWAENDFQEVSAMRFGFTEEQARSRCCLSEVAS